MIWRVEERDILRISLFVRYKNLDRSTNQCMEIVVEPNLEGTQREDISKYYAGLLDNSPCTAVNILCKYFGLMEPGSIYPSFRKDSRSFTASSAWNLLTVCTQIEQWSRNPSNTELGTFVSVFEYTRLWTVSTAHFIYGDYWGYIAAVDYEFVQILTNLFSGKVCPDMFLELGDQLRHLIAVFLNDHLRRLSEED